MQILAEEAEHRYGATPVSLDDQTLKLSRNRHTEYLVRPGT
jgi:hypothetical protein